MDTTLRLLTSIEAIRASLLSDARKVFDQQLVLLNNAPFARETAWLLSPADAILESSETEIFTRLRDEPPVTSPRSPTVLKPVTYIIMKATRLCNLRCTYCHSWKSGPNQIMGFEVLARAIRDALALATSGEVHFVWHGGETTILSANYYKKALWLQYAFKQPGVTISNSMQTNATRLTPEWIDFIKTMKISVGVSLDGPPEIHDLRRIDTGGHPTSTKVTQGIAALRDASIPFGVLMVVDAVVAALPPRRLLEYLISIGVSQVALLNALPPNLPLGEHNGTYFTWHDFIEFLQKLFPIWWSDFRTRLSIRELESLIGSLAGASPTICEFAGDCMGQFLTVDPNGNVSACDKYIGDDAHVFGNLLDTPLAHILSASPMLDAAREVSRATAQRKADCQFFPVCSGGCPHDMRLNERNSIAGTERCCGLAPLLKEIVEVVGSEISC